MEESFNDFWWKFSIIVCWTYRYYCSRYNCCWGWVDGMKTVQTYWRGSDLNRRTKTDWGNWASRPSRKWPSLHWIKHARVMLLEFSECTKRQQKEWTRRLQFGIRTFVPCKSLPQFLDEHGHDLVLVIPGWQKAISDGETLGCCWREWLAPEPRGLIHPCLGQGGPGGQYSLCFWWVFSPPPTPLKFLELPCI